MAAEIVRSDLDRYLHRLLPDRDKVLAAMEEYAHHHLVPIVGPAVGRLLFLLVRVHGAKRIFEMGSAIGYSTIWLARAAGPGAEVHYTDGSKANAKRAAKYIERAGVADMIRMHTGDSLELLRSTAGEFDFIFNDVDKHQYPEVFPLALSKLKRGGLLVTDNTLWGGKVVRQRHPDQYTRGVLEYNRLCYSTPGVHTTTIPLRDGVSVSLKL